MTKLNFAAFVCLFLTTIILSFPLANKINAQEETFVLCQSNRHTIRIYQLDNQLMMRVFDRQDKLVWLNTIAKQETSSAGINYSNIRGEQTVRLFIPKQGKFCSITIGESPSEKGKLLELSSDIDNNSPSSIRANQITGTVTYRQRIALIPGAIITVKLLDVSRQDVAAEVISEQTITTTGEQVPIPFRLKYNPTEIKPRHSYAVRAEIRIQDKLAFTTTRNYPVITNDNPYQVDLVLEQVSP